MRSINSAGYKFRRAVDYADQVNRLHRYIDISHEFSLKRNSGAHTPTALVELPENEDASILEWATPATALQDVLLLLSLFTQREVFAVAEHITTDDPNVIWRDTKEFTRGGTIRCSKLKAMKPNRYHEEFGSEPQEVDLGLEDTLNVVYKRMCEPAWGKGYAKGAFLHMVREAFRQRILTTAFTLCWTIWEHLFDVLNAKWLSSEAMRFGLKAKDKIAYVLVKYALRDRMDKRPHERIKELANIRNRLVHSGRFPEGSEVHKDAEMFIRMTEFVVARILGLCPEDHDIFDTVASFEAFLGRS